MTAYMTSLLIQEPKHYHIPVTFTGYAQNAVRLQKSRIKNGSRAICSRHRRKDVDMEDLNYTYQIGSVAGTYSANQNLVATARAAEADAFPNMFPNEQTALLIKKFSITVSKDCKMSVNGGTKISLTANEIYTADYVCAHSITIDTAAVDYVLNYGY